MARDPFKRRESKKRYERNERLRRIRWALKHLGGVCQGCGTDEKLEFDHINPEEKEFEIGQRATDVSLARFKKEVAKCRLLCFYCHVERSAAQRRGEEWVPPDPWDVPDEDDDPLYA